MKKSFKKLGFVSLATSSVLLGSMNATNLETYAALQKPSHVFGNYVAKKDGNKSPDLEAGGSGKEGNSGSQASQQQAQTTASSDSQEATKLENTATADSTTANTDKTYENSTDTTVANATKQVETDNTAVQKAEGDLKTAIDNVNTAANSKDFNETTFTKDQTAEQTAEKALETAEGQLTKDQNTLETDLQDQNKTPTPSTPPPKEEPSSSGNSVASQLVKDATTVNSLKSVSVSGMNTTLSGVETMSKQTATISALLNSSTDLSSVISNAQGLSSAFGALESAQNTLKGYLDSSSTTIGQLTNGSNAVVGVLDKAINQVDTALADLVTTDTQKTQAVTLAATGSSASSTTTDAINFLNALKTNLMAQKDAFYERA